MSRLQSLRTRVSELIGGGVRIIRSRTRIVNSVTPTVDAGVPDYSFLDRARRGKARGLEISGLLLKPLGSKIASWSFGKPPKFKGGNDAASEKLNEWWIKNHSKIIAAFEESLNLADMYIVVNPDASITLLPPDVVNPIVNPDNFSEIVGWETNIVYQHPTEPGLMQHIRNEYYANTRVMTIATGGKTPVVSTFRNFTGLIPVIHIANNRGTDEMNGHSEWEALIPMLQKYGAIFSAAIEGNIRQGRPTPVISRMGTAQDVNNFWARFGKKRTVKHPDGTSETEEYLDFDGDKLLTLGADADFAYKSPSSFTNDTSTLLGLMFYLLVEHGEIPEGFLGSAIPGSRASLDTQMEPLVKFIEKKQAHAEGWVLELVKVVLALLNIIDSSVSTDDVAIKWPELTNKDGRLMLDAVKLGREEHLIDRDTALRQLPLDIENYQEVLDAAEKEAQEAQAQFDQGVNDRISQAERNGAAADKLAQQGTPPPSAKSARTAA